YGTGGARPGDCPDEPQPTQTRPKEPCPLYRRDHLSAPIGLVVDGTMLVTGPRFTERLQAFMLEPDGSFPPFGADPANPTSKEKKAERKTRTPNQTTSNVRYLGLTVCKPPDSKLTQVIAPCFKGFVDIFEMPASPSRLLAKEPDSSSFKLVASTPTRTTVRGAQGDQNPVLYVAAGELDRVQVFRLSKN